MAPWYVSNSHDDGICVADFTAGIYRSLDGGSTWDLNQKTASTSWHYYKAVKVKDTENKAINTYTKRMFRRDAVRYIYD